MSKRRECGVFIASQDGDWLLAEKSLPPREAIRWAREFNAMFSGTTMSAVVIPYPISPAILRASSKSRSA